MVSFQGVGGGYAPSSGGTSSANAVENDMQKKAAALAAILAAKNKSGGAAAPGAAIPNQAASLPPDVAAMLGLNADQMAHNEFAPQYQLLDQMRKQAEGKYNQAGKDVGGMYDALSKSIRGNEGAIKGQYAASGKGIGDAYNQAIAQTNQSFGDSRNQVAELAKRLGIEAGLPSALEDGVNQQGRLAGLLASNKANQQGVNKLLGNNDVAYNRESADTAGLAGVNARADFKGRLMAALEGYNNKELDLNGQEAQAENKYDLSIKDMMRQSQEARDKLAHDDELGRARLMLDQGKFKLDSDKFDFEKNKPGAAADPNKMGAYETLASLANSLYGNPVAARNASQAIEDTFTLGKEGRDRKWTDANEFMQDMLARNPQAAHDGGDYRQLQQLALAFYNKIAGGANKAFGYNTGM